MTNNRIDEERTKAMIEEEFEFWTGEGDKRPGRCPYCGRPGWIVGDTDWCEHYVGTYDAFLGSDPVFTLINDGRY